MTGSPSLMTKTSTTSCSVGLSSSTRSNSVEIVENSFSALQRSTSLVTTDGEAAILNWGRSQSELGAKLGRGHSRSEMAE